jgi:hypothetical protein
MVAGCLMAAMASSPNICPRVRLNLAEKAEFSRCGRRADRHFDGGVRIDRSKGREQSSEIDKN